MAPATCQESQERRKAMAEDESWEIDSSTESDLASESESEAEGCKQAAPTSFRVAAAIDPQSRSTANAAVGPSACPQVTPTPAAPTSRTMPRVSVGSVLQRPEAATSMARQVLNNAQAGGLMSLVTHLRADNARLREALVAAQREAEALMEEQRRRAAAEEEQPSVDFGHLLALVKDFGADGLGGSEEDYALEGPPSDTAQFFSMESPRGEQVEQPDTEVLQLREELEESKAEVARLRAELEAARGGKVR